MILVLSLLIAISISTIYHSVSLLIIVRIIFAGIVIIRYWFFYKSSYLHILKHLIYITIIFVLSGLATWWYDARYWNTELSSSKYFQWDVLITKVNSPSLWYQRYDIVDENNLTWILRTKWNYNIWDVLQISADIDRNKYLYERLSLEMADILLSLSDDNSSIDEREYSFDYDRWLKMKGYVGILDTNHIRDIGSIFDDKIDLDQKYRGTLYNWFDKLVLQMRAYVKKIILSTYHQDKYWWLMLGMVVWDRSLMPKDDYDGFIESGLVHLIAVSGGNISMIVIFIGLVLFFLPYYIRIGVILVSIILYSLVCGLDSSVFRAMIMWWLTIFAIYTGRVVDGFRVLGLALFVMLLYNPYFLIYDMWFVLSFMATLGIMIIVKLDLTNRIGFLSRYKIIRYIWSNYIIPSIWAVFGILPVLLFYNSQYNLTWFVWNLIVVPIVPIVMVWGIVVWLFSDILSWDIFDIFLQILIYLLKYIYSISELINQFALYISVDGLITKLFVICLVWWGMWRLYHIEVE